MSLVRSLDELMVLPPIEVITSPWARPASWAGPLATTPATAAPEAPEVEGDPVLPELPPKNPPKPPPDPPPDPPPLFPLLPGLPAFPEPVEVLGVISTPRKAVSPMCTVDEADPASIVRAMERAVLIGMENPWFPEDWPLVWNENPAEAAVSSPSTSPEVSTSGPPESPGWMSALDWIKPLSCSEV